MQRLFEKNGFVNAEGMVLPLSDFRLFRDLQDGDKIEDRYKAELVARAEPLIGKEYKVLRATDYLAFARTGSRAKENAASPRREDLIALVNAEIVEDKGRFVDSICDLVWMILEESTWVISAHNKSGQALPPDYDAFVETIDLYSAFTAATLAYPYRLVKDKLDAITTVISERMKLVLRRRAITPFINALESRLNWWTGTRESHPNNWNPWICSNVLWVTAVVEDDLAVREAVVTRALEYLDNFISGYTPDGGCNEGAGYWRAAGAAYMDCLEIIADMTGGKIDIFHEPLLKNVVEYIAKAYVANGYYLTFADCSPKPIYKREMLATYAKLVGSDVLMAFARSKEPWEAEGSHPHVYRGYRHLCTPEIEAGENIVPLKVYFPDLQVAATRECQIAENGLYIAMKGGHNKESHNHNDLGSFIVYSDGKPMFVDTGSGTYTKRTFSALRYTIWTVNSDYHNTLNFGDTVQMVGREYRAKTVSYDENTGKYTLDLTEAYPAEAGVVSYERSSLLENGVITITDSYKLNEAKRSTFTLMTLGEPESVGVGEFVYMGRTVKYDPSLEYSIEVVPCDTTETANVPAKWQVEKIYRIKLTTPVSDHGEYVLTIR